MQIFRTLYISKCTVVRRVEKNVHNSFLKLTQYFKCIFMWNLRIGRNIRVENIRIYIRGKEEKKNVLTHMIKTTIIPKLSKILMCGNIFHKNELTHPIILAVFYQIF